MIYSISYDLNRPGQNYDDLYDTIKSASGWVHPMDSLWFISTYDTIGTWSDKLMSVIDKNDRLFIVDITGQSRQGWMDKKIWEWLSSN